MSRWIQVASWVGSSQVLADVAGMKKDQNPDDQNHDDQNPADEWYP